MNLNKLYQFRQKYETTNILKNTSSAGESGTSSMTFVYIIE